MRSAKQETESCFARNKARNKKDGLERRDYTATHEIFACKATVLVIFASHLMHLPPCDEVLRVVNASIFSARRIVFPVPAQILNCRALSYLRNIIYYTVLSYAFLSTNMGIYLRTFTANSPSFQAIHRSFSHFEETVRNTAKRAFILCERPLILSTH